MNAAIFKILKIEASKAGKSGEITWAKARIDVDGVSLLATVAAKDGDRIEGDSLHVSAKRAEALRIAADSFGRTLAAHQSRLDRHAALLSGLPALEAASDAQRQQAQDARRYLLNEVIDALQGERDRAIIVEVAATRTTADYWLSLRSDVQASEAVLSQLLEHAGDGRVVLGVRRQDVSLGLR